FSRRRRHTRLVSDWSSDVCSSDLRVEDLRDLLGMIPQHIPQDQRRALARWQELQRSNEGQRYRFSSLIARLRPWRAVGELVEQRVGIGVEPQDLAAAARLWAVYRRHTALHPAAAPVCAQQVQAAAGGDPIQPGSERRASFKGAQTLPGSQQRLLQRLLGVVQRAKDTITMRLQLAAVRCDE